MQLESIRNYFQQKSVLLTGATGFFGQFIVFKLIKFCEVANIFIVLRPKRNETIEQRFEKLLSSDIFMGVDNKVMHEKIIPIEGDVTQKGFGFTANDREIIKDCVLFIHSAASVRLNVTLSESLLSNTNSTRNALEVCRQLPKLEKFVYVSTIYVFDEFLTEEKIHQFPVSATEVNGILDCYLSKKEVDRTVQKKLESKNSMNNYFLSKTLSEILVAEESKKLDTLIFRPAAILPSIKEPFIAWFSGEQIVSNFAIYISKGLWHVSNLNPKQQMAVIPVDICGNALLKAISFHSSTGGPQRLIVINAVTNSVSLIYMWELFKVMSKAYPMPLSIRPVVTSFDPIENQTYFKYKRLFVETFFAICVDFVFKCYGWKPMLHKNVRRMQQFLDSVKQCSRLREIKYNKLGDLWNECSNDDKRLFNFNPIGIQYDEILVPFYHRLRLQLNGGKEMDEFEVNRRQFR